MEFRTKVETGRAGFRIGACEEVLLVGSCFASEIGQRFRDNGFPATVNPYGTMYNPASILHTLERMLNVECGVRNGRLQRLSMKNEEFKTVFLTLGTNHVYRLKETGEIVDNCEKRPAALFEEEELTVDECAEYLRKAVELLRANQPEVQIVLTVSPIRYRKYGYHESQLSKATLLLAIDKLLHLTSDIGHLTYFPAYEIVMDELRDYRFYAEDMIHLSKTAEDYIFERMVNTYCSEKTRADIARVEKFMKMTNHRIQDESSPATQEFKKKLAAQAAELEKQIPGLDLAQEKDNCKKLC